MSFGRTPQEYQRIAEFHQQQITERRTCIYSGERFPIYEGELYMLRKLSPTIGEKIYSLPLPVAAPHIRKIMRKMRKNERNLYYHSCDLSNKKSVSRIHPDMGVNVYTNEARASDARESTAYGIQLQGSVLQTVQKLSINTPYQDLIGSLTNTKSNALYTNYTADITDSYLVFDAHTIRNCYYLTKARRCEDCVDCVNIDDCQRCVGCYDSKGCFGCVGVARCSNCVGCRSVADCVSCQDCIGCVGLQHKQYCVYNKQLSKEDYFIFKEGFIKSGAHIDSAEWASLLHVYTSGSTVVYSENSSGKSVRNCENIVQGKDLLHCQDMWWCDAMSQAQDCMDVSSYGHESSRMMHCAQVGRYSNSLLGCVNIGKSEHLMYCIDVKKSRYCFGCVNMKGKEYCIFNTQYSKQEYFEKLPGLIAMMQHDGSRGQPLSAQCNIIAFNDSKAFEEYPVREVISASGKLLYENNEGYGKVQLHDSNVIATGVLSYGGANSIPVVRKTIPENIVQGSNNVIEGSEVGTINASIEYSKIESPIRCEKTGKLYRIMKPELDIYKSLGCVLPSTHPNVRYRKVKSL